MHTHTSWHNHLTILPCVPNNPHVFNANTQELKHHTEAGGYGGFLPAMKQIANVAALPGIVGRSIGLCPYLDCV